MRANYTPVAAWKPSENGLNASFENRPNRIQASSKPCEATKLNSRPATSYVQTRLNTREAQGLRLRSRMTAYWTETSTSEITSDSNDTFASSSHTREGIKRRASCELALNVPKRRLDLSNPMKGKAMPR